MLLVACENSPACKSHLHNATQLYEKGSYGPALEEFQAAYVLSPYPPILYNIARLHHKQNRLTDAISYYQRYLDSAHKEQGERARTFLAEAQAALASKTQPPPEQPTQPLPAVAVPAPPALIPPEPPSVSPAAPAAGLLVKRVEPTPRASKPIYRKWWFWTVVGVTVIGASTALGIGLAARGPDVSRVPRQTPSFDN